MLGRNAAARPGATARAPAQAIPSLPAGASLESFLEAYSRHHAVLIKGCAPAVRGRSSRKFLQPIRQVFAEHPSIVHRTFTLESAAPRVGSALKAPLPCSSARKGRAAPTGERAAAARLLGAPRKLFQGSWYASFVVQHRKAALKAFLSAMPFEVPPFLEAPGRGQAVAIPGHSDAVWVFFGRNPASRTLTGRSEHTDAISHSGTWHLQLHGSKVWTLRPTRELQRQTKSLRGAGPCRVRCLEGDVLCVNTRLWWHQTQIPARCDLSVSVARDMYLDGTQAAACDMTNVEGHYATQAISRGAVLFTEEDAPDAELPRCPPGEANCAIREGPDGRLALVAKRKIRAGDWFCISESENEDASPAARQPPAAKRRKLQ